MFQSCRICFRLKSNHEVRMSVTERRFLPAVRQCLVVSLRLRLAWLWCRRLRAVRWLPGYLLQLVGSQIRIFLLQELCHVHFCLWMWCNLQWLLILVGNFCCRYILLRQHQFFSLGDFTDFYGWAASVTVQERPVAWLSVAPQAAARQPVNMQSEAARAVQGRSQICNTGVTSAYGHVVNLVYRPYDNANGAQGVADILQPVSSIMFSVWQPGSSASAILPPVSIVNNVGQAVSNISINLHPVSNVGQTFSNFSQPATSFWQPVLNYSKFYWWFFATGYYSKFFLAC